MSAQQHAGLRLALRFALREMRGGLTGFYVFLACIALGVAAISGVNSVAQSITGGMVAEGRTLLGGDLAFRTTQRRLTDAERDFVTSRAATSEAATMRAMARLPDGSDQSITELKAVNPTWPLVGAFTSEPEQALAALQTTDGIIVDPILLDRLGAKVGDRLGVGNAMLNVIGTVKNEPDRVSDNFAIGPRVLMSIETLEATGLVQPGTIVNWTVRARLNDNSPAAIKQMSDAAKDQFPQAGWRVRSSANAAPALTRNIERFSQFLTLVGLTALIVGGVGVANAVRAFLDTKRHVIASFKCLGAPANFVVLVYLLQIAILALLGIAAGLVVGALLPLIATAVLSGVLPLEAQTGLHWSALASASLFGLLTALAFALWPLGQARDIPATALFRNADRDDGTWPRFPFVAATFIVVALLVALAVSQAADRWIATVFIIGIAFAFVLLRMVAILIQIMARRWPAVRSTPLRLAIGNIHRPGALTASVVLSLGLGLALLVSLALIDTNLRRQISSNLPTNAPDFFFVDIQSSQFDQVEDQLKTLAPNGDIQAVPMLRGRIVSINDVPASEINATEGGRWVLRGDRGITYSAQMPQNATLAEGEWWPDDHAGEPLVSFSAEEAGELGVVIGDRIAINVLGREITATVSNLRHVEWQSMSINFVMVFSPNTFAGAPHAYMATLRAGDDATPDAEAARDAAILKSMSNTFPTVTVVRVRDALTLVNGLIGQLATAIRAAALLALAASVLVLGGALAAGNRARVHDAVVLKTLGAKRRTLIGAYVLEYSILGALTALFALAAGGIASWFVIAQIMGFSFTLYPQIATGTLVLALAFTIGFGLIGTWRVLGQKAAPVLREL